ncbi:hypothetical protein VTN96DRAFT_6189 [Rasamsonia emersonii]
MPTLQNLICHVEQIGTEKSPFNEYAVSYGDRVVESYIAVPPGSTPFAISLKSNCFIFEGLSMFVFIDGLYQCNRNRCGLSLPDACAVTSDASQRRASVEFRVRQKEEYLPTGECVGKAWSFAPLDTVHTTSCASPETSSCSNHLGSIEVYVLRCFHRRNSQESLFDAISDGSLSPESATSPLDCSPLVCQSMSGATTGLENKIRSPPEDLLPNVGSKYRLANRRTTLDGSKDSVISRPEYSYGKGEHRYRQEARVSALSPPIGPCEYNIQHIAAQGTGKNSRHDPDLRQHKQQSLSLLNEQNSCPPRFKHNALEAQGNIDQCMVDSSIRTSVDIHSFETPARMDICKFTCSEMLNVTSTDRIQYSKELRANNDIEEYCYIISPNLRIQPTGQWHHHDSLNSCDYGRENNRANGNQGLSKTRGQQSSILEESKYNHRQTAWAAKSIGESISVEFHKGQNHNRFPHGHMREEASWQSEKNGSSPTKTDGEWDTSDEEENQNFNPQDAKRKGNNTDNEKMIENEWDAEYTETQITSKTQDSWETTLPLIGDAVLHDTCKRTKVDDQYDIKIGNWLPSHSSGTPGDGIPRDRHPGDSARSAEEVRAFLDFPVRNQDKNRYGTVSPERIDTRSLLHEPPFNGGKGLKVQENLCSQPPHLTGITPKDSPGLRPSSSEQNRMNGHFSSSSHIPGLHFSSYRVQLGSAERYIHNTANPKYIDTLQEPFAKFVFKYREKRIIEKMFGTNKGDISNESKELEALSKTELIARLLHTEGLLEQQTFPGNNHHKNEMHISCKTDGLETERSGSLSDMRTGDPSSSDPWVTGLGNTGGLHIYSTDIAHQAEEQSLLNGKCMNIKNTDPEDCGTSDNKTEWIDNHDDQQHREWECGEIREGGQSGGDNTKHGGHACPKEVTNDKADW